MVNEIPGREIHVIGDDAIADYLQRLQSGQLTEPERHVGQSRRPKLGDSNHGTPVFASDEFPDENMPND